MKFPTTSHWTLGRANLVIIILKISRMSIQIRTVCAGNTLSFSPSVLASSNSSPL